MLLLIVSALVSLKLLVTLTPARPLAMGTRPPSISLMSIDLTFAWKTRSIKAKRSDSPASTSTHPFSPNLLLPFQGLLNQVIEKFVTYHLVRFILPSLTLLRNSLAPI
jgi:hypothetical protein